MSTLSRKRWIVHHLLAAGETSVWYGEPGSGKSVLIEDLGLHVAAGRTWHGRQVSQGAVLYVALERAAVVARRAIAFGMRARLSRAAAVRHGARAARFPRPKIAAEIVATLDDLAHRHGCEPALIIVDTVSRALCGGDEKSPEGHGPAGRRHGAHPGASACTRLTHHQPVEKERMRGHGALLGAVDTTVHVTKSGASRLAEVVKSRDHEEGQRVAFTLKSVIVDQDEYGDPITAPVVVEEQARRRRCANVEAPPKGPPSSRSTRSARPSTSSARCRRLPTMFRRRPRPSPSTSGATTPTAAGFGRRQAPRPPAAFNAPSNLFPPAVWSELGALRMAGMNGRALRRHTKRHTPKGVCLCALCAPNKRGRHDE